MVPNGHLPMVGMVVTTAMEIKNGRYKGGHVRDDAIIGAIHVPQDPKMARNAKSTVFLLTFTKLQFVKDGGFTGGIKPDHKDSHLLLAELHCKERNKDKDRKHT